MLFYMTAEGTRERQYGAHGHSFYPCQGYQEEHALSGNEKLTATSQVS